MADVNIPVGEVFTSPVLEGTNGVLHVSRVYLDGLQYKDLELKFKDGKIVDYRCGNFKDEEEGRRYIFDNVLKIMILFRLANSRSEQIRLLMPREKNTGSKIRCRF